MKALYLAPLLFAIIGGIASITTWYRPVQGINLYVSSCSDGWRITGYFTPLETDYASTETSEIDVVGAGKMSFNAEFLRVVFNDEEGFGEGWGKTRFGWYLGKYNGRWHKSSDPLDAHNTALRQNSIAVDNALIPNGSTVTIPGLPGIYGKTGYVANDVGATVHGKHIDIYTGEGKAAEHEMYRVTFEDEDELQRVCFQRPQDGK
jgi:3D (Asp-Asp-Asp) domain-containing protein